jgi:hypothetical protein
MATLTGGYYAIDGEVYYVTPSGRAWIIASVDHEAGRGPEEIDPADIPAEAEALDPAVCSDLDLAGVED